MTPFAELFRHTYGATLVERGAITRLCEIKSARVLY
jgi:hypothetical protein